MPIDEYQQVTENETEKANKEIIVPVSVTRSWLQIKKMNILCKHIQLSLEKLQK